MEKLNRKLDQLGYTFQFNPIVTEAACISEIKKILKAQLPSNAKAYLVGSRADGTARENSDFDVVIDAGAPVPLSIITAILSQFDDVQTLFQLDVVDLATASDTFKNTALKHKKELI